MQTQTLNGNWQFRQRDFQDWLPACVPGSVHLDLMAAGRLPDPFTGLNEDAAQWVAEKDWVYRRFFYVTPTLAALDRIYLVCEGLDTLAEVRLNDKILSTPDNMFRTWRWEVKAQLKEGENHIDIVFRSPLAYIRAHERIKPMLQTDMGIRGGQHLRKAPSHFGWDWGPKLPCIGIWKEVRLEGYSQARLLETRFSQQHRLADDVVTLTAKVQCELWQQRGPALYLHMYVTAPDSSVRRAKAIAQPDSTLSINLYKPQLWWPNGMGQQPLYQVEVEIVEGEPGSEWSRVVDSRHYEIGLRTIALQQAEGDTRASREALEPETPEGSKAPAKESPPAVNGKTPTGRSFTFVVNGVPIFARGSNWIPADSFPTRVTPEQLDHLIGSAAEANHNMLRVWGGGYYESDLFYQLCDRYGILVWQDCQFACATYPLDDPTYVENASAEIVDNVRRLRHHACLALWCGNNEIEWMSVMSRWNQKNTQLKEAYERFFFHTLPETLTAEDPDTPYWPSSPSSNDPFNAPGGDRIGDAHLWEVYHGFRPPAYYRKLNPRFVSEFGFQSLPGMATIAAFTPENQRRLEAPVMLKHQRVPTGNAKLIWYLAQRFRLPQKFEDLAYLSQVFQAETIRIGVEHWRRHPERTSGALYWQLNDCWPVISWSSIDYYGRWKALHYAARRFFAPVLFSVEDLTERGQRKMAVWITNDSASVFHGRLHWSLETLDGNVLEGGDRPLHAEPLVTQCIVQLDFANHKGKVDWRQVVFVAELWQGDERAALHVAPFVAEKDMRLGDPGLHAEIREAGERVLVRVSAKRLARFIELSLDASDSTHQGARFSNNYFDLPAGRMETVECVLPDGWTVEQAREKLRVRSLNQMEPCDSLVASHWKGDLALMKAAGGMLWSYVIKPLFTRK